MNMKQLWSEAFQKRLLKIIAEVRTARPETYHGAAQELYPTLEQMQRMTGGSIEDQLNRAALSLIGGAERFLAHFRQVPLPDVCCPRRVREKMIALSIIAMATDPEYASWKHPEHPEPCEAGITDPKADENEMQLFALGAVWYVRDERDDYRSVQEQAWRIAGEDPEVGMWYHAFFEHAPLVTRVT